MHYDYLFMLPLVVMAALVGVTGYLFQLVLRRPELFRRYLGENPPARLAAILEVPTLVVATALVEGTGQIATSNIPLGNAIVEATNSFFAEPIAGSLALAMMLLPSGAILPFLAALLIVRWVPWRPAAIWAATLIMFGSMAAAYLYGQSPWWDSFSDDATHVSAYMARLYGGFYVIPEQAFMLLVVAMPLATILAGIVAYSIWPRWYAYAFAGLLVGVLAGYGTSYPRAQSNFLGVPPFDWREVMLLLLGNGFLLATIWMFPRMRASILGATGLEGEAEKPGPVRSFLALGRCSFVGCTALLFLASVALVRMTHETIDFFERGPAPLLQSPALANGWEAMRPLFGKDVSDPTGTPLSKQSTERNKLLKIEDIEQLRAALDGKDRPHCAENEQLLADLTEALDAAGRADYLAFHDAGAIRTPNFGAIRETCRWLEMSARYHCLDGDWRAALEDISILYRYTRLDIDGNLVNQMIQSAVRSGTNDTTAIYWQAFRNDREAMIALADLLDETSTGNRRVFPVEALRRYEIGKSNFVILGQIAFPGSLRATTYWTKSAANFDALRMAVALELYRLDKGQYPGTLDAVVPEYLPRIPPDPFDGKPWHYEVTDERVVLETERYRSASAERSKAAQLYAPPVFVFSVTLAPTAPAAP